MNPLEEGRRGDAAGTLLIWGIPLFLSVCGVIMITSLSLRNSVTDELYSVSLKQVRLMGMGMTLMAVCAAIPLHVIRRFSSGLWALSVLLVIGTLIPGVGVRAGGAQRWLNMGFIFQPLELLLLTMPIFLADRLASCERQGFHAFMRPTVLIAAVSAGPLLLQPNLGGIILVGAICLLMHVESRGWTFPLLGGILAAVLVALLIWYEPYRMRRFLAFWDPWDDPMGKGFQIIQGLVAFANGGLMGVGIGRGLQVEQYLPEAQTDYIFSAIGEEFGLMGTLILLSMYALWTFLAYKIYRRARSAFLSSMVMGLTASVVCPMFLNLCGVLKLMPLAGVPLPFLSSGGSSLLFMWGKIGVLLAVNRAINRSGVRRRLELDSPDFQDAL